MIIPLISQLVAISQTLRNLEYLDSTSATKCYEIS